jgi:hypothetical protein
MDDPQLDPLTTAPPAAVATDPEEAEKPAGPQLGIPMTDEVFKQWTARIDASKRYTKELRERWKTYIQAYMARYLKYLPEDHRVVVPLEFAYVELKAANLAIQVPEFHLSPKNPRSQESVPLFQQALNHEIGSENADFKSTIDQATVEVLACCLAAAVVGYQAHTRTRKVPVMTAPGIDPFTGQPTPPVQAVDEATGEKLMQDEEYVCDEEYYIDHIPCEHALIPVEFVGVNFDKAGWLGYAEEFPVAGLSEYGLTEDDVHVITDAPETLSSDQFPSREATGFDKRVRRVVVWYQAYVYDRASNPFPKQYRKLVLLDGYKGGPVVHEDSPYQWVGDGQEGRPADGLLHGMEGNPINILTIRYLPGSAYPLSDVQMGMPQSQEISLGRTQMMRHRDRATAFRAFNREKLADPEIIEKLKAGQTNDWIGVDGNINEIFGIITPATYQRENFEFDDIAKKDFETAWAMSNPGMTENEARTATEVNKASGATQARLEKERTWVLRWLVRCATKFGSLLQQYMTNERWVEIVGDDGVKALQSWDRTRVQGEFVYTAKPDSAIRLDADVQRRQDDALYNLIGRDPNVRRVELLRTMLRRRGMLPDKIVVETPPQEPKPEPPKISINIKGEDLNPMMPQYANVLVVLQATGMQLMPQQPPQAPAMGPGATNGAPPMLPSAPHPGAALQADVISKHALRGGSAPELGER